MKVVWIPANLHRALRLIAVQEETTIKDLTEIALREYLERRGIEIPEEPLEAVAAS